MSNPARTAAAPPIEIAAREIDIEELYRAHARTVARWAARLGGPGIDVEDVVQEVFLIAKRRLRTFSGDGRVTTWLFRATSNVTAAARRKQRLRRWLGLSHEIDPPGMGAAGPTPPRRSSSGKKPRASIVCSTLCPNACGRS